MLTYFQMLLDLFLVRSGDTYKQRGATLIEYALIIAAIAVVVLFGALTITDDLTTFFTNTGTCLSNPAGC